MSIFSRLLRKNYLPVVVNPANFRGLDIAGITSLGVKSSKTCDTRTIEGQRAAYMYCPAVAEIINYKVQASCNARFIFVNSDGEETKSNWQKLISKPNAKQNWLQFWQYAKTMQQIFGRAYVYARKLPGISVSEMYVIPNWEISEVTGPVSWLGNGFGWSSKITGYEWQHQGMKINIAPSDVLIMNDTGVDVGNVNGQYTQGQSRLLPLGDAVQNIIAAYEARNMLLTNAGPPVIISPDGKDMTGGLPMKEEDKDEFERKFMQKYGYTRNKKQIAFSTNPVKATFIGKNPNDLAAFEEVRDDLQEVCRGYGVPAYIFGIEGTTFNNLREARKALYQNTTIPETIVDLSQFVHYFGMNETFSADFSHVDELQKSETDKISAFKSMADALKVAIDAGIISRDEARAILNENVNVDYDLEGGAPEIETQTESQP